MAVIDRDSNEHLFARALDGHLRLSGAPLDKWLRYSIYVQLHQDGGILTAHREVVDTGFRTALPPDVSEDEMSSLTDSGVQTGQLGSEGTGSMTDWTAGTQIQGGGIREPVRGTAFDISGLKTSLRQTETELAAACRQRDEASALALRSLELLRMVPTASMSSDIEQMHYALVADPRTSGTEALLAGFLSATVDRRAGELVRDSLADVEDKHRMVLDRVERVASDATAEIVELRSRLSYQRYRGWCEMGLVMVLGIALIGWLR